MNNADLLNSIKNDLGLEGKGLSAGKAGHVKEYADLLGELERVNKHFEGSGMSGAGFFSKMLSYVPVIGAPMGYVAKKMGMGKKRSKKGGNVVLGTGMTAGSELGQGMTAGGLTAGGMIAGKRKYVRKSGAGMMDIFSKIANASPFSNVTAGNPLSQLFGDQNVKDMASKIVGRMISGGAKRAKKPASAGVMKRAEIVKKVMKERGISMIQASKAVKAEGLY